MKREITVVEFIKPVQGKANDLKNALQEIVPLCRREEGCIQYELLESLVSRDEFLVLMKWRDIADLHRHEGSKVIQDFVAKYDGILYTEVNQTEWTSH